MASLISFMREGFEIPTIETGWMTGLYSPSPEFDATGAIIDEIRTQKLLGGAQPGETPEAFLERYREARKIVETTPIHADFDVTAELEAFYRSVEALNDGIQAMP